MSFIPATSNRDLLAVLGVMAVTALALMIGTRERGESPGADAPDEGIEPPRGSAGPAPGTAAPGDDGAAGGEPR